MQYDLDVLSPHKDLFEKVRDELLKVDSIKEIRKNRITTYELNGSSLCHLRTTTIGVDIGFLKGVNFDDEYKALTGNGKKLRVLSLASYEQEVIRYYLHEAIRQNC